ncbi:Os09g0415400, partial [Oryza sativa Japonica Group]
THLTKKILHRLPSSPPLPPAPSSTTTTATLPPLAVGSPQPRDDDLHGAVKRRIHWLPSSPPPPPAALFPASAAGSLLDDNATSASRGLPSAAMTTTFTAS